MNVLKSDHLFNNVSRVSARKLLRLSHSPYLHHYLLSTLPVGAFEVELPKERTAGAEERGQESCSAREENSSAGLRNPQSLC